MSTLTDQRTQDILDAVQKKYGFVPNVVRELCENPVTAQVYLGGMNALAEGCLSPEEQQLVALTISRANGCGYCVAAHATVAKMHGVGASELAAVTEGDVPHDPRLSALVVATRLIMENKGWLQPEDLAALGERGVDRAQVYEIVTLIGLKTITNYVNHMARTPIDPQFGG